ncbi:MAG: cytochrome C oxidase subunit II [Treponema sp.]|jgi:hypothetical protein|nr:cytochrome C oxidase subunit II [Treponema sp.]
MGVIKPSKNPDALPPEEPEAGGFRASPDGEYGDLQREVNQLLEEETAKAFRHLADKLPRSILEQLDGTGGVTEKLYGFFSRNYRGLLARYMTAEDETAEKMPARIDTEEAKVRSRHVFGETADPLKRAGGAGEPGDRPGGLFRQKTDIGAFIRSGNACSIVKCAFKDNPAKPTTVTDVKLSVNIPDSELMRPAFRRRVTAEYLIKDILSIYVIGSIDREIEKLNEKFNIDRLDTRPEEPAGSEITAAKPGEGKGRAGGTAEALRSGRNSVIVQSLSDWLAGLNAETGSENSGLPNIRENFGDIPVTENIRNLGFNSAVNAITSILDAAGMGYQYIENLKNARELLIREYEDTDTAHLPDERYQLRMRYYDNTRLIEERKAYDVQIKSFETEVQHLWDVLNSTYEDAKFFLEIADYADLAKKRRNRIRKLKEKSGDPLYEDIAKVWDEISFVPAAETEAEQMSRTCIYEKDSIRRRITMMKDKLRSMYDYQYPRERRVMEDRLDFLEGEYRVFAGLINPYHIRSGLLLDVDVTSVKRRKTTLDAMVNILGEFLHTVSGEIRDEAPPGRNGLAAEDAGQSLSAGGKATRPGAKDAGEGGRVPVSAAPAGKNATAAADKRPAAKRRTPGSGGRGKGTGKET